ncbi:MAG: cobalamin biosynthesis protein [Amaricoccus sp.]
MGEAVTVAGIGCRRGVAADEVLAAVATARAAHAGVAIDALATVPGKVGEPALGEAARRLRLPLLAVSPADDAELLTRSAASRAAAGTGSVSEGAALAAAGAGARLLGPRVVVGRVTCAIAMGRRR